MTEYRSKEEILDDLGNLLHEIETIAKDKSEIREEVIEEINDSDIFVTGELCVLTPEEEEDPQDAKDNPLVIVGSEYLVDDSKGITTSDIKSDFNLDDFLIREIERVCKEKGHDTTYVIKGVINFLTCCQCSILSHFNMDPETFWDELEKDLSED